MFEDDEWVSEEEVNRVVDEVLRRENAVRELEVRLADRVEKN